MIASGRCIVCHQPKPPSLNTRAATAVRKPALTCSDVCERLYQSWSDAEQTERLGGELGSAPLARYLLDLPRHGYVVDTPGAKRYKVDDRAVNRPPCKCPNPDGPDWGGCPHCRYVDVAIVEVAEVAQ